MADTESSPAVDDLPSAEDLRPRTSTRDLDALRDALQRWLEGRVEEPIVSTLEMPSSNGLSSETVLFEVGGSEREPGDRLVARLAPSASAMPVFPTYDLGRQAQVMELVRAHTAVRVPRVRWWEPDSDPVGSPFFVMDRVDGRVPPDLMPYNFGSWLSEAAPEDQRHLQDATVGVVAAVAGLEDPVERAGFLVPDGLGRSALRRHVAEQGDYCAWVAEDLELALLRRSFAWLEDHWPAHEGPTVLSWGDSRIGNIIYDGFEPAAVLDWEMASLAPPEVDIGWLIFLHRFFEDVAAQYGMPGMPTFLQRDDVAAQYESLTGYAPRDLDFYTMYAAVRHGIIMSRIQRRAVHFGEAEMPDDPDDLIAHRATLEAMLAGTYWS